VISPQQDLQSKDASRSSRAASIRVAVDLDNTLICYDNIFVEAARAKGLVSADFVGGKQAVRDLVRTLPDGEQIWQQLQGEVYGERIGGAELYEGAEHFFRRCRSEHASVWIVSHKTRYSQAADGVDLQQAALEWLASKSFFEEAGLGLSPEHVFLEPTRDAKIARLALLNCTHVVDDLAEVLDDPAFPVGAQRVLFDPSNEASGRTCLASWRDIETEIFGGAEDDSAGQKPRLGGTTMRKSNEAVIGSLVLKLSPPLDERSKHLRRLALRALGGGGRGHVGSAMSLMEILRVLYDDVLQYRPAEPDWVRRDRLILSKGHGCVALYAILADKGFFPSDVLDTFCRRDSILGGHPESGKVPGVEASTGALGHGLAYGIGMALAARIQGRSSRAFVIMGDGETNEGSVWEGALSAGKHHLSNLTVIIDYNKIQAAGPTSEVQPLEPIVDKWRAFNFAVTEVDGHDVNELRAVLRAVPLDAGRPTAIICHTVKGKGFSVAENNPEWHHKAKLTGEMIDQLQASLG
jgi:transketolase